MSPRLINTLYDFLHSEKPGFIHKGDTDQLLLLSHSLGGSVGFEALAGESTLATCSGTAALLVHMTMCALQEQVFVHGLNPVCTRSAHEFSLLAGKD